MREKEEKKKNPKGRGVLISCEPTFLGVVQHILVVQGAEAWRTLPSHVCTILPWARGHAMGSGCAMGRDMLWG